MLRGLGEQLVISVLSVIWMADSWSITPGDALSEKKGG